jgi:signal transduction histidine kinase
VSGTVDAPRGAPPGSSAAATGAFRAPRAGAGWPFLPLAPLAVAIVGLAVALGIGLVGVDHLSRAGDEHAGARAELLAATVAARLSQLPDDKRLEATQLAARRSASQLLVVAGAKEPRVVYDASLGAPDGEALTRMLAGRRGVVSLRLGRARYAVRAIGAGPDAPQVVALVPEPSAAHGAPGLISALVALATILLGVAAAVAYAVSRDVTRDVDFVTRRVQGMTQVRTEPTGELIPPRTMDQVGLLTTAFNKLVGRFGKAEKAYREDLARASAADRERAAFLAAVSHELRSPLNAILGFADILMEEVDGPLEPTAREEVEQIRGSGAHLLALINDILELSALESGQLRLSRGRVDLTALANEVVREARGLVGEKPLTVRVEAAAPVVARVDQRRIRQVLGNLVNNAIKFTQRGEVVVRVAREGGLATLSVSDTGPGISPQERAVIFQEYKQTRAERQRRRGTGLGLAIARRLVLLHHGSITVESELGRGSTFKVLVPIGNVEAAPSIRPPAHGPGPAEAGGRRPA